MALPFILGIAVVILGNKVRGVSARALEQFAGRARRAAGVRGEVDVLITSNVQMRKLNWGFRGKNQATDVLSFPSDSKIHHGGAETQRNSFSKTSVALCVSGRCRAGDIAISAEIASRNARRLGHSAADEMKILILHGLLHLAGYDHEIDGGAMARKEARLRRVLGLPTALIERTSADGTRRGAAKGQRS